MFRVTTERAIDAQMRLERKAFAAVAAAGIETLLPLPCDHRDRPSCPKCSARRTVQAAAAVVRETGGVR